MPKRSTVLVGSFEVSRYGFIIAQSIVSRKVVPRNEKVGSDHVHGHGRLYNVGARNESLSLALVKEQMKLIRPILSRHNVREVKTIGDAFLVEFTNALDAVRCAYDIQRTTREFNFSLAPDMRVHLRIGVHLGEVVVSKEEEKGDISGEAVNVTSRIDSLAEEGGVVVTRQIYDHVHNKFELPFENLGPKQLKNVSEPVEVYRIIMPWEKAFGISPRASGVKNIAVLPFANMSPNLLMNTSPMG